MGRKQAWWEAGLGDRTVNLPNSVVYLYVCYQGLDDAVEGGLKPLKSISARALSTGVISKRATYVEAVSLSQRTSTKHGNAGKNLFRRQPCMNF